MKHRLPFLLALLLFSFLLGCKGGKSVYKTLDPGTREYVDLWKSDPVGCKKLRTGPIAEELLAKLSKSGYTETQLTSLLGPPEQQGVNGETRIIGYYWDTSCVDGKMKSNSVSCLLQFFLNTTTGKTESGGVVCG